MWRINCFFSRFTQHVMIHTLQDAATIVTLAHPTDPREKTMRSISALLLSLCLFAGTTSAATITYTENFNDDFPAWESNWLGVNSNLHNYYELHPIFRDNSLRGDNLDGLWLADENFADTEAHIRFNDDFGRSIINFSIDITTWDTNLFFKAYDMDNNLIHSVWISSFEGAYDYPGNYQTISFDSTNGLRGFSIVGGVAEGNTSIDNVIAVIAQKTTAVSESSSLLLMMFGALALVAGRRRQIR